MTKNDLDNESVFNWSHVTASIILLFMCIVLHWFTFKNHIFMY